MLPRHLRLRRSQDFQVVRRRGKRWQDVYLSVIVMPNKLSHNRFGFVVSKQLGNAVNRNQIRRRLRAAVAHLMPHTLAGYDVIVSARRPAANSDYDHLLDSLEKLLANAQIIID